jgi:hypothetical protein
MANKTIYVKDEDLQVFEEAEKLGGDSLSGIIAEALRRFVAVKRAELFGMQEYTLSVGVLRSQGDDDTRKVRFVGRLLAEADVYTGQTSDRRDRGTVYQIYQTKAGKVLIWWKRWTRWERENDYTDYAVMDALPGYDDDIFGRAHGDMLGPVELPGSLLQEAAEALGEELVEYVE